MKLLIAFVALLLIGQCTGMTDTQAAYLDGMQDGWHLAWLRMTDIPAYNIEVAKYNQEANESLDVTEAGRQLLAVAVPVDYELPEVFR